jgi:hypothetical protein
VALGTALQLALIGGIATLVYACRALGMPLGTYLLHGLGQPGLITLAFVLPALALRAWWNPMGWVPIAIACAACWLCFAVCAWRYGISQPERERWGRMVPGLFGRGVAAAPAREA